MAAAALALAGCGESTRQDAGEQRATYTVAVSSDFPARQGLAEESTMRITVRNRDDHEIPNLTATIEADDEGSTVEAFGMASAEAGLASRSRPVWIVDESPAAGETAYPNTWALGPLPPGATRTFSWRVTAIRPGRYELVYRLAGSTGGATSLVTPRGTSAGGRLSVTITRRPRQARVTERGAVVREPAE